jgi:sporulation protein YlmC with PRC-barrel domain
MVYNDGMYARASNIENLPIISLQTSEAVARLGTPIIDISTLEIVAFRCEIPHHHQSAVLITRDIRQVATDCFFIDNEDELADPHDIVRLAPQIHDNFSPLGKPVVSDIGRRLGVVDDYSINLETHRIQKLYVRPSGLRAWIGTNLTIDRTQILDVSSKQIVVRDAATRASALQSESLPETPH